MGFLDQIWSGRRRLSRADLQAQVAQLTTAHDAAQAENAALKARFQPLLDAEALEPALAKVALDGIAGQLDVATAALRADQRNELDAPQLELDALDASREAARGLLETTLNLGEARKKKASVSLRRMRRRADVRANPTQ